MNVGLFGGTFNPPTLAHQAIAQAAWRELDLDVLLIMPNNKAPHKHIERDPGPEARLELCQAFCQGTAWQAIDWEIRRTGPSYTVDSLKELHRAYPASNIWFVCGADTLNTMDSWHEAHLLPELAKIAVAPRQDEEIPQTHILGLTFRVLPVTYDMSLSSTYVRNLIYHGHNPAASLPAAVNKLIEENGYYQPVLP